MYHVGVRDALSAFSVTKCAGTLDDFIHGARVFAIGQPIEAAKQLARGKLFHPEKGLYAQGLPRTLGSLIGMVGVPLAMTALEAKMNPQIPRGELVGSTLGSHAGSILGMPLGGMVGAMAGSSLLGGVGRALGKQFDKHNVPSKSGVVVEQQSY